MYKYKTTLMVFGVILISSTMNFSQIKDTDYKIIEYSKTIQDGESISKKILDKGDKRIIAEVTLHDGKALGIHTENIPFMVYSIAGEGVLVLGNNEKSITLSPGVLVTVEAGVSHDVIAKPNLSILVVKLINNQANIDSYKNKEHHNN